MAKTNKSRKATVKLPRRAQFTINDVIETNPEYSAQTIRTFVRNAIASALLWVVGKQAVGGRGRPRFLLSHAA